MPKFKCINDRCDKFHVEKIVSKVSWIWSDKEQKLVLRTPIKCSCCDESMEYVKEEGEINVNLLRFDSLNPEDKRAMLRKRNREHYEKHDKARVESMRKQVINDNRQQFLPQ